MNCSLVKVVEFLLNSIEQGKLFYNTNTFLFHFQFNFYESGCVFFANLILCARLSKMDAFIGQIYTGDRSSVWDELGQRTVARLIIRLEELSTMVRLTRRTIVIGRVDG